MCVCVCVCVRERVCDLYIKDKSYASKLKNIFRFCNSEKERIRNWKPVTFVMLVTEVEILSSVRGVRNYADQCDFIVH